MLGHVDGHALRRGVGLHLVVGVRFGFPSVDLVPNTNEVTCHVSRVPALFSGDG